MSPERRALRVVLDTNVLFSSLALPKDSPPSAVLALLRAGKLDGFLSPFILEELEKNLLSKSGWTPERLFALRENLKSLFSIVEPTTKIDVITRVPADNRILECAVDAGADVLVTGNMKDLRPLGSFQGIEILTPREFLDKYGDPIKKGPADFSSEPFSSD